MRRFTHMQTTVTPQTGADLISSDEVARIFGVSRATVNRWAAKGAIPVAHVMTGQTGARLYDRAEIDRMREQRAS